MRLFREENYPWANKWSIRVTDTSIHYSELIVYRPNIYSLARTHLPSITRMYRSTNLYLCIF